MRKLVGNEKRNKLSASEQRIYDPWKIWIDGLNKKGRFGTVKMKCDFRW